MFAFRILVPLLLAIGLVSSEDKTDGSKRPKKDIGLKIREALAASEHDAGWSNLGNNLGVSYQQPSYATSFGYQQPSYATSFGYQQPSYDTSLGYQQPSYTSSFDYQQPNYASSFGYQQPNYASSFNYQLPSYGSRFNYQPQFSTSGTSLPYIYKYYKYYYPSTGLNQQTFQTTPQVFSQLSTPQVYSQDYNSVPSLSSNLALQTEALIQPYSSSYQQSYPSSSFQTSTYDANPVSTYQEPLSSSYAGSSNQQAYQSYPSTSYQTYPVSNDYSNDYNKLSNSYLSPSDGSSQ